MKCACPNLRPARIFGAQTVRPHRHRRALRQTRYSRQHAPLAWRRRNDRKSHLRENHIRRTPARFEAGTPPITEAIGLAAACNWLSAIGWDTITAAEHDLYAYAEAGLATIPNLRRIGTAPDRCSVLSFVLPGTHAADLASVLDMEHIAIRAGHHCAQPVLARFGVPATARASLGIYSNRDDIDRLVAGLKKAAELFG